MNFKKPDSLPPVSDKRIREAIETLPWKNQRAVLLRFWHCQTIEEISKKMRMDWVNTDNLIEQSKAMLKKELEKEI